MSVSLFLLSGNNERFRSELLGVVAAVANPSLRYNRIAACFLAPGMAALS